MKYMTQKGRRRTSSKKRVGLSIDINLLDKFDKKRKKEGHTRTFLIEKMIKEYINSHKTK